MAEQLDIVILGLSITSSWGNGHAVTYRGLVRALVQAGHRVTFAERDVPWYAAHRDLSAPPYGELVLYRDLDDLRRRLAPSLEHADAVILGSYVPEGPEAFDAVRSLARGVKAFYDIDTPVTLRALRQERCEYLRASDIPDFDLYLSFSGGPTLDVLERDFGARRARALYCSADLESYRVVERPPRWTMGYLGTYSDDRQPRVEQLLDAVARQRPADAFVVAGAQYPEHVAWAPNVERIEHLPPAAHAEFYASQRLTLNVTRDDMIAAGYSPSIRLFEAAACGTPIISDRWPGIETIFTPGEDILIADTTQDVLDILERWNPEALRRLGESARRRVLEGHTAEHRAAELVNYLVEAREPVTEGVRWR